MSKLLKQFESEEEYFADFDFATNSQLRDFEYCRHLYKERSIGAVKRYEKPYFTYGKAVDCILSGRKLEEEFYVGSGKDETIIELEEKIEKKKAQMTNHAKGGTMTMAKDLAKLEEKLDLANENEGKTRITPTEHEDILSTAKEIRSQPLYDAFRTCKPQIILATEVDTANHKKIKVKGMLDKLCLINKLILDDKTTAGIAKFEPEMYVQQVSWYRMLTRLVHEIICDCYIASGDKGATYTKIKRSSLFYFTSNRLDYQEELNLQLLDKFQTAKESNDYHPCIEEDAGNRETKCFGCDHYDVCAHSRQKKFIIV